MIKIFQNIEGKYILVFQNVDEKYILAFQNVDGDIRRSEEEIMKIWLDDPVEIHTANPVGRANMESVLARYWGEEYW